MDELSWPGFVLCSKSEFNDSYSCTLINPKFACFFNKRIIANVDEYRILLIDLFQSSEDRVYQIQIPIPTICEQTERWGTQFH